jgi:hypothetical protein
LAAKFYGRTLTLIKDSREAGRTDQAHVELQVGFQRRSLRLDDFVLFRERITQILQSMDDWRPRKISDLFVSEYKKRFEWWIAIFRVFFGCISILILGVAIWTAVVAQKQYQWTIQAVQSSG